MALEGMDRTVDIACHRQLGDLTMLVGHIAGLIGDELPRPVHEQLRSSTEIGRHLRQGLAAAAGEDRRMEGPVSAIPLTGDVPPPSVKRVFSSV